MAIPRLLARGLIISNQPASGANDEAGAAATFHSLGANDYKEAVLGQAGAAVNLH
jgi:hypothetical protein